MYALAESGQDAVSGVEAAEGADNVCPSRLACMRTISDETHSTESVMTHALD
jgi:hypothetical protein